MASSSKYQIPFFVRLPARAYVKLRGWELVGDPVRLGKAVVIGAPHTSSWDALSALALGSAYGMRLYWVGKHTLFKGVNAPIMRFLGGIPVDRGMRQNFVDQMIDEFGRRKSFMLAISPEGTRSRVEHWKTGFYYIAVGAGVPIVMAKLRYDQMRVYADEVLYPSGDLQADFAKIQAYYADAVGHSPANFGAVQLPPPRPASTSNKNNESDEATA